MSLLKCSAMRIKRKGEIGPPYLIPREGLKIFVGDPFNKMEKKGVVNKSITHSTHSMLKPYALSIFSIYC